MYTALAGHFFKEFQSRLNLEVDAGASSQASGLVTQVRGISQNRRDSQAVSVDKYQNMKGGRMTSNSNERPGKYQNQKQTQQVAGGGSYIYRDDTQQEFRIDDSRYFGKQGVTNDFSREDSPTRMLQNSKDRTVIEESGGQHHASFHRRGAISNSLTRKENIQVNDQSLDHNRTAGSRSRTQLQAGGTIRQDPKIEDQRQIMNQKKAKDFLRIGDIVVLAFHEKVYEGAGQEKIKDKSNGQSKLLLAKITDTPELEYKGIICSDGVTNKGFMVYPKSTNYITNGSSQFKKCLFRIEIAQECKYHIKKQILDDQLDELERERDEFDDNSDYHQKIEEKIVLIEKEIAENDKYLSEEIKNNEYELQMNIGKKITYGQKIQLKHLFSLQYMTLNLKRISQEYGCINVQLSDLNEDSWFMMMPSQKIKQIGQSISYLDTFYIQNYIQSAIEKPKFYVHININEINNSKEESILELNGSFEPSRIKARLFIDYQHMLNEKMNVHSGDTVRLYHKEAKGWLTVNDKDVDFILPDFPDFLQKQLQQMGYNGAKVAKKGINGDDDGEDHKYIQQEEAKKQQINKIYIETNEECLYFTNTCWEVQNVKSFRGGSITWDDYYRLKHIGTGKYLAISSDRLELTLKDYADFIDTLFCARKETYRINGPLSVDPVKTMDHIVLETYHRSFIQIAKEIEEDDIQKFEHKVKSHYYRYSNQRINGQIPLVCGMFSKEDASKMIFQISEVSYEEAQIAYQGASFFQTLYEFYNFLNMWGVILIDEDEDSFDKYRYDFQAASASDQELGQNVEDIEVVLHYLHKILYQAKDKSVDNYIIVQKLLAEQGLLQILIKLLELIYFKTVPHEQRELAFESVKAKKLRLHDNDDEERPEYIARDSLDPLAEKLLGVILMMIKHNQRNCEKVTKYDHIIFMMLVRYETKITSKIFKETFKQAQYIYGDKSAAITNEEGIDGKVVETNLESAVGNQYNQIFGNQINKWADMLDTVSWLNEKDENITKQILYINVISMICKDTEGKGIHHFQLQAVYNILQMESNVPLRFGIQKREVDKVFVFFVRKPRENAETFFKKNPMLRDVYKQNMAAAQGGELFDIVFDIQDLSTKPDSVMPYIDYMAAVINMYSSMCLSRNHLAIQKVKELGLNYDHVLTCINNKYIHEKLKAAYIQAARVLFIDNDPFPTVLSYRNRCYFWNAIQNAQAHRTMYNWEKNKYYNFQQNRILAQEQELNEDIVQRLRDNVYKFFKKGPDDIIEFLYGYKNKKFYKKDIDPKLVLVSSYIENATSLIECEHVDSKFVFRMLKITALIFIGYHNQDIQEELEKYWIVPLLQVSKTQKRCRNKIEVLESKTLKMLEVIGKYRLNSQVLIFLQFFRQFVERNEDPNINTKITEFDDKFQVIFQLFQFNIDKNQTQKKIKQVKALKADAELLKITEIQLAEMQQEEFMIGNKKMDEEDIKELKNLDQQKKQKMVNDKYELDKFLLYLIFAKKTNKQIRNQAVSVLNQNFIQRDLLMNELIKIELIISEQDQKEYQEFKFQHYRLQSLVEQMIHDDLYYLLYMNLDKEKYKICIQDIVNILKGLTANLNQDTIRMAKKQNMLRHIDISNDLINKLMKNIYFREFDHYQLFAQIINFLFMYSYQNSNNQRHLMHHLNYLVTLTDKDIPTPKLIAQILLQNKHTEESAQFLQFLTNKVVNQNIFKSSLFKLLSLLASDIESNQVFILKRLVKKKRFRKRLYMDTETSPKKVDLVIALKKKIGYLAQTQQKNQKTDEDKERVDLHLSVINLLSVCAKKSLFGRMQARKLVNLEVLIDSILSEAVPYKFKKGYLRLLYQLYLDDIKEDLTNIDYNSQKFYDMMKYVIYEDLRQYCYFYLGLLQKYPPEAKRDNEIEKERERVSLDLERLSKADIKKRNAERTQLEIETFKENKIKLSTLKSNKGFPLIDDSDYGEYWNYLSQFKKSQNKADGLLHFIYDFYTNIRKGHHKRMSKELVEVTIKIREVLMQMSDDLHRLLETYKSHLKNIDQILFVVGEAISSIPNVRSFKAGKNFNVKGGGEDEGEEAQIITEESENEEMDESKVLDIRMASEKVIRILRDHIIQKNCQIRDAFKIESIQTDVFIKKFQLKTVIKEIAGTEATFEEIEKSIQFFTSFSKEQQQERRILQVEVGQEGHIKTRQDPSQYQSDLYINFRDFEMLLKKSLQKAGYKPPHQKRERVQDEELNLQMLGEELSIACNKDLKLYAKCFFDFYQRFKNFDELTDIVNKVNQMFYQAFESNQKEIIKGFIQNMMTGFVDTGEIIYLLKILNMILQQYMPSNFEDEEQFQAVAKDRLFQLQVIMKDCGLMSLILKNIDQQHLELSNEGIKVLCSLLCESNTEVQEDLLKLMKQNRENFSFFSFVKDRLVKSSEQLIKDMEKKLSDQITVKKVGPQSESEGLYNLHQQPFYVSNNFDLENEINRLKNEQHSNELLNILRMIQLFCDNCHQGFQDYLRNQEENSPLDSQPLTTVNLVGEVANVLIKLTSRLEKLIFTEFILYETVQQIFDTLIDFLHGPNIENQRLLGRWKKLMKVVNFYMEQDMGYFAANTTAQQAKLSMMYLSSKLLLALVESVDEQFKRMIMNEMIPEISLYNLKKKMVDIYLYKIGGNERKLRIYYADKKCDHWRTHDFARLNMCEKDEYCQYGHLIKFDKKIISSGFNIFLFLYSFKEAEQHQKDLLDFDYQLKNDELYNKFKGDFNEYLKMESEITPQEHAEFIEKSERDLKKEVELKSEMLLQKLTLIDPQFKMYVQEEDKKKAQQQLFLNQGIDQGKTKGEGGPDDDHTASMRKNMIIRRSATLAQRGNNRCKRLCCIRVSQTDSTMTKLWKSLFCCQCCHFCRPKNKRNQINQIQIENHPDYDHEDELENTKLMSKKNILAEQDDNYDIKTSLNYQYLNEEKYSKEQFKLETAIRFYISNVANIEIDQNGRLAKVMFRIPPFCTFFTQRTQKDLVYGAKRTSQQDKLEDFFVKIKMWKAEMKALQRLARRSTVKSFIVNNIIQFLKMLAGSWEFFSYINFFLVLIINLMFIIFYQVGEDGINLEYNQSEVTIELIGIVQAFFSFIVMFSYLQQYHGAFWQKHLDQEKIIEKDQFTNIKGSLGFAYGLDQISNSSKENIGQGTDSWKQESVKQRFRELGYAFKIFFVSMRIDTRHNFHVFYFILSFAGIFFHPLFSLLLLDVVIKIPLLQNVVQAIVQNKKQLFYTAILLFVILYIYSFIAFEVLRDGYINAQNSPDSPPDQNLYCDTLLKCFTSTLNNGLRAGGGVGDMLAQLQDDDNLYWARYVFDLTFFCIVTILLLNLIFGIIIDAFADMRDERNSIETDVMEKCFICGLGRFEFEAKSKSWLDHIYKEHNVYAYLYFILYVQRKPGNECTGVEKYVKTLVSSEDPAFFPVNKCLAFSNETPII